VPSVGSAAAGGLPGRFRLPAPLVSPPRVHGQDRCPGAVVGPAGPVVVGPQVAGPDVVGGEEVELVAVDEVGPVVVGEVVVEAVVVVGAGRVVPVGELPTWPR
jgi:hypothetical protein